MLDQNISGNCVKQIPIPTRVIAIIVVAAVAATAAIAYYTLGGSGDLSETTEYSSTAPGMIWFSPHTGIATVGASYSDEIHVNTGSSRLGAYSFTIIFSQGVIDVDTSRGEYGGVDAGPDGFVTMVNTSIPGQIRVNGFNVVGTGPGNDLNVLTVYWTAVDTGTSALGIIVKTLTDEMMDTIGVPNGINGARAVA